MPTRSNAHRFDGKVAFVTGAARGQGRNHALALAKEGADIIAVDICEQIQTQKFAMSTPEDLEETVRLVEEQDRRIVARKVDVRDGAALKAALDEGVSQLGRLDVCLANAGTFVMAASVDLTPDEWHDTIDTDLSGAWNTVRVAVPHIRAHGEGGAIVMTSSVCGLMGVPGLGAYNAAKHGVVGLMRTMAIELGPERIRVNTVNPGSVDTPMVQNEFIYNLFYGGPTDATREDALKPGSPFYAPNVLPTPWLDVDDITNAILFLASDEGRYITGHTLVVDAGYMVGRWG
jgi:SDR family mycofactocin-dependent oxidoreductase